jgi:hypothetical protein
MIKNRLYIYILRTTFEGIWIPNTQSCVPSCFGRRVISVSISRGAFQPFAEIGSRFLVMLGTTELHTSDPVTPGFQNEIKCIPICMPGSGLIDSDIISE